MVLESVLDDHLGKLREDDLPARARSASGDPDVEADTHSFHRES
jgi:hypothetical protein